MLQQLKASSGKLLSGSVLEPNPRYGKAIGVLGVALPPTLVIWAISEGIQGSISAYYYTSGRDWFVGTLWVIGVFLIFYQFKPQDPKKRRSQDPVQSGFADAALGKLAGVSAVLVALLPTTPPEGLSQPAIIGMAHGAAAFVAFLSLSLFPLRLFSEAKDSALMYKVCGSLMLLSVGLIVAHAFAPESVRQALAPWKPVLLLEWFLIWVFAYTWFKKGQESVAKEAQTSRSLEIGAV